MTKYKITATINFYSKDFISDDKFEKAEQEFLDKLYDSLDNLDLSDIECRTIN
jgi:hypothetical protein